MGEVKFQNINDIEKFESIPIEERLNAFNTYDLIKNGAAINPDATAISFFLSGDTYDQPMHATYRELMANITKTANLFHDLGVGPHDVISYLLPNLPHTHYVLWGGEAVGIVNPINPLLEPATIAEICQAARTKVLVALAEFPESDIWEKVMKNFYQIVDHYNAVSFSSVPTVLSVLLDVPKGDADISSLRYAICGAAPLSIELFKRFEAHSGMKILEGYGLTEGTCASSFNPYYGQQKIGSIGLRLPYMQMKIFIVDEDGKFVREAATDEIGSVCIHGPNVFSGYLEGAHNRGIWPKEGWLNTGDQGRKDADGYFWLTGRTKELIIRGGHNIDPAVIEDPLYQLEGVQVAAAVGQPDSHAGETPVAYVQLQENVELTEADILTYLKDKIGERAAVPKEVFIVDEIPLTPVGKIFKPSLRWQSIQRVYETELQALDDLAEKIEVSVNEDKIHGSIAKITIKSAPGVDAVDIKTKADDTLARFTVKYKLTIK